ncbi:MAG: hypothetical protein OXH61_03505 [Acidimicrobiaceae bacterium]|nr:hypothetical protein [Acidimicrobiaceae bacterium]
MGTSGAYTGAGGKPGKEVGQGLSDWLDSLSGLPDPDAAKSDRKEEGNKPVIQLPPEAVSGLLGLLRPRFSSRGSVDGPGSGGGGIGARTGSAASGGARTRAGSGRSSQRLASVGGRAGAGAIAYVRGDTVGLRSLGLDYDELRSLRDPLEVTRRIVNAACGQKADCRMEEAEERYVAASVAGWVLEESQVGELPDVDDVARYAIATIVVEVLSSEFGEAMHDRPDEVADVAEDELRDAAWVLAEQAELSASGPTENELTTAVEDGIERLRRIYGGAS